MQLINATRVTNIIKDIQYIDFWNTPESSFTAAYDLLYKGIKFDIVVLNLNGNMLAGDEIEPDPDPDEPDPPDLVKDPIPEPEPDPDPEPDPGPGLDDPDPPHSTSVDLVILFVVDQQHRDLFFDLAKNIYLNRVDRREEIYHMIAPTQEGYKMPAKFKSNVWSFRLEFN